MNESEKVVRMIQDAGGEAFLVGGCVRDSIMGKHPHDEDIATSMTPDEVMRTFKGCDVIGTGLKHGTVTVVYDGIPFEVTTYRKDGEYSDGRHPDSVTEADSIEEDLSRRDFTMNAIALDPVSGRRIDPFGGEADIRKGIIRCVGNPDDRFQEDALRMLRAVRFSCTTGMEIVSETLSVIGRNHHLISRISGERIASEISRMIMSGRCTEGFRLMRETGLLGDILPEIDILFDTPQNNPHHIYDVGNHTMEALRNTPDDLVTRLAVLFHDAGKPAVKTTSADGIDHFFGHYRESERIARSALSRLRYPRKVIDEVAYLVRLHESRPIPDRKHMARFITKHPCERDTLLRLSAVMTADCLGQNPEKWDEELPRCEARTIAIEEITAGPWREQDLAINGNDILAVTHTSKGKPLKINPKDVGSIKKRLLMEVIEHPEGNTREHLLKLVPQFAGQQKKKEREERER